MTKIETILRQRLKENGRELPDSFSFGPYVKKPNTRGMFLWNNRYYVYETDEKGILSITGPFAERETVYVIALMLHVSELFSDYQFEKEALQRFIHCHYRSIEEIK